MKRTHTCKTIIIQTTPEMDNWLHPQTPERLQRLKDRKAAAAERFEKMRSEIPRKPLLPKLIFINVDERNETEVKPLGASTPSGHR